MHKNAKIYIAGHNGLVGSALVRKLKSLGYSNLITRDHKQLDLTRQKQTEEFFKEIRPEYVFMAAAKVGGIHANNSFPADFIYRNLAIETNMIHAASCTGVNRLMFLGSSCIYPCKCPQPIKEEYLLTGPLEKTNDAYAVAKIAGIAMCHAFNRQHKTRFIAVMPTNLYGPNDNFDPETSHVLPALLRRFHEARIAGRKTINVWGTGTPRREFLHADDLADACVFIMNLQEKPFLSLLSHTDGPLINIGAGKDISIAELAQLIQNIVGFKGQITFDPSRPDGTFQKLLDTSRLTALGWQPEISLAEGIESVYRWYLQNQFRGHEFRGHDT